MPKKDNQIDISRFLVKQQENKQFNHAAKLPKVIHPILNNTAISCYTSLSSPTCKTLKEFWC